ncbi:MAG: 4-hydroxy-tetrahydrodipicolinate reductase [Gammaproteobacteria bacterium]|nr:4-hydroxy-tetrahydrodipicolinate reductase [Gammaproteobacteria bacterium]
MTKIRVLINGASGKMGQEAVKAVESEIDLVLVGALNRQHKLADEIKRSQAQVVLDLTSNEVVYKNAQTIIEHHVHPVIGTSGLLPEQIALLQQQCKQKKLGGIIAPNFSIGAVLMMSFVKQAAAFFDHAEIIELHHPQKKDAPSGTAMKTAELMNLKKPTLTDSVETLAGARGAEHRHVRIHSVRLPGLLAHQEVLLSGEHELLTIRHDSFSRASFMPGVILSIRKVMGLSELVYGLENIM